MSTYIYSKKKNSYLAFLESGEVHEMHPESEGKEFRIHVVCKYEPTVPAKHFISQCSAVVNQAGFQFEYEILLNRAK